jgi:hypothetical protein
MVEPSITGLIGQRLGCMRDWTRQDLLFRAQQAADGKSWFIESIG